MKKLLWIMMLITLLASCRSSRRTAFEGQSKAVIVQSTCLSSKLQLSLNAANGKTITVNGQLKMLRGERVRLSFIMPMLRTEMVRIEITPNEMLVVDRKHREYVCITPQELKKLFAESIDYAHLERTILAAASSGDSTLTGRELKIPSLEDAYIRLYDFSASDFLLPSTTLSDKYRQIPWEDLMQMLSTQL